MKIRKAVLRTYYVVRFLLLPVLGSTQMNQSVPEQKIIVDGSGNGDYKTLANAGTLKKINYAIVKRCY